MNRYDATELPLGAPARWDYPDADESPSYGENAAFELCPSHAFADGTGRHYFCTGPVGHRGDHAADTFTRCAATWPQP